MWSEPFEVLIWQSLWRRDRYLATCSADTTVKIWSISQNYEFRQEKVLQGHQRWVWDCAFSADSAYLVTGKKFTCWLYSFMYPTQLLASSDHTARLWEMASGETVRQYNGHHKGESLCPSLWRNLKDASSRCLLCTPWWCWIVLVHVSKTICTLTVLFYQPANLRIVIFFIDPLGYSIQFCRRVLLWVSSARFCSLSSPCFLVACGDVTSFWTL
jgi:WD40 repeat protein